MKIKKTKSTPTASAATNRVVDQSLNPLHWLTPIALAIVTYLTYFPSLRYAFQFDDEPNILKFYDIRNKHLSDLFFTSSRWFGAWLNTIHYQCGKFESFVYRRTNVLFHCASGILVYVLLFLLLRRLKKNSFWSQYAHVIAGVTSALFLLHPVQTQTISYVIQGQLEGISGFFCLAVLTLFVLFTYTKNALAQTLYTITIFILSMIACGTKEITIVLPLLTLLIDWFFIAQGNWQELKTRWWLHAIIALTVFGCEFWFMGSHFFMSLFSLKITYHNNIGNVLTEHVHDPITPWLFFISQFRVIVHYLFMFIWPLGISVDYDWKMCTGLQDPTCVLPFILLAIIFLVMYRISRQDRISPYVAGLGWFFICMIPRSTIMPSTELLVDYKTYLGSVGWLLVIAVGIIKLYEWIAQYIPALNYRAIVFACAVLGTATLSALTYQRNLVWRSALEFWKDVVCKAPNKARGYNNYGIQLLEHQDNQGAIWHFKHAIQMEPYTYPDPYNNLAAAYAIVGEHDLAISAVKASIRIQPRQPKAFNNLGILLMQSGNMEEAKRVLNHAIELNPHYGKGYFNLGRAYYYSNDLPNAWQAFKNACTVADYDGNVECILFLAQVSEQLKKYQDATQAYQAALQLEPGNQRAQERLAKLNPRNCIIK